MGQPQLVIISGPTATGKTALAIELATRYGAEIVSADSRQVYRYLDIGTAKPTLEQQAAAPHHLIDVVDPDQQFDSARFRTLALAAIHDILQRGKRVLVVGGTGLYLRALTRGLFAGPPADPALRARLYEQEQSEGRGVLHRWLITVDPEAAARLHPNDTVRLIRALEVFLLSGTPLSRWQRDHSFRDRPFATLTISLVMERETLARRIEERCRQMMCDGLIEEVRRLWEMGYGPKLSPLQTIGYAQIGELLQGHCGLENALARIARETRRLAKRQLTWLRAEPEVRWFAPMQRREITETVEMFLSDQPSALSCQLNLGRTGTYRGDS
jgi:tRNA dimethylallyltransferase